jgi:hypothetical protein
LGYNLAMPRIRLADRLLAEWVRRVEEDAGHPQLCPAADAAGVSAGGDLAQRIVARARALPGAQTKLQTIRRVLRFAAWFAAILIILATLSGIAAASAALGATTPASLPLVLLAVVATNLLMLLLWLIAQLLGSRIAPGIGSLLQLLSALYARRLRADSHASGENGTVLRVLGDGARGRWFAAALVHAAWLGFALGAVLAMALLLSVRAYELSWATTLLSEPALAAWAQTLSLGPALLGIAGADTLPVDDLSDSAVRQAWSWWLLAAATIYGVLPRALALLASLLLLWRAQRATGRDLSRPGYARLRARLLPDHAALGVVDAAPPEPPPARTAPAPPAPMLLRGRVHGLALEATGSTEPPPLPDVHWIWLGNVDDTAARETVLRRLRDEPVDTLAICVRATLTPDRGIERYVSELAAAARAPTTLLLGAIERLQARGSDVSSQRLQDWQSLARRAGASVQTETSAAA